MAFEVSCSQCQGRLMVEQAGQVVACPHCGAHLAIPDSAPAVASPAVPAPATDNEPAVAVTELQSDVAPSEETAVASLEESVADASAEPAIEQFAPAALEEIPPSAQETQDEIPVVDPAAGGAPEETAGTGTEEPPTSEDNPFASGTPDFGVGFGSAPATEAPFGENDFDFGDAEAGSVSTVSEFVPAPSVDDEGAAAAEAVSPTVETTGEVSPALQPAPADLSPVAESVPEQSVASDTGSTVPAAQESAPAASPEPPAYQPTAVTAPDSVPRSKYVLVLSWASAATIAALFLAYLLTTSQTSQLESLPDVKPPKKDDQIVYKLVPEDADMPPGHVLTLGETQRYGNLKVTATRVTRGPVQFEHYDTSSTRTKDDGPEVLKLWLKFENVSSDQSIAPLDELVFQRDDRDFENVRANIFLTRASQKSKSGARLMVYDLNTSGDWNLKAQQVQHEIPPGGELETYIPTTPEGVDELLGADEGLVWRVHFRKGYSPKNYGVTTVIEVTFGESDIEVDPTAPATPAPADNEDNARKA